MSQQKLFFASPQNYLYLIGFFSWALLSNQYYCQTMGLLKDLKVINKNYIGIFYIKNIVQSIRSINEKDINKKIVVCQN